MQQRKHQFFSFIVILLGIGFLNYFRRIANGYKLSKYGKVLYLTTMILFVTGAMLVLYVSDLNNITSFLIGLGVTVLSEHLAKLFIVIGDSFNPIVCKIIKTLFKVDLTKELTEKDKNQVAVSSKSDKKKSKEDKNNQKDKPNNKPIILKYIQSKYKRNKK